MPRSLCLCLGLLLAGGVCLALWHDDHFSQNAPPSEPSSTDPPVLVLLVGEEASVTALRTAVDPARIVARSAGGFALAEGRIVAADHHAAERILTTAGWLDRKVEIVPTASSPRRRGGEASHEGERSEEPALDLLELSRKPTLTVPEAIAALRALEGS
jgi:hypothetical protein